MYFAFLIEDQSGEHLIRAVMEKVQELYPEISFETYPFKGIGGFTPKNTVKETKTGKLLNDLATYLRGFNKSLAYSDASIFVVVDNDTRDTDSFRAELENVASRNLITIDHVFCIAVEEMEAWLLGDEQAIINAYPSAKTTPIHSYQQDSICGTWEVLADALYPGGHAKLRRDNPSPMYIGKLKSEWAENIGKHLNLAENRSPSFQYMISEIFSRVSI